MAEFIGTISSDFSLPLPETRSICFDDLKFRYEGRRRTILLFQVDHGGSEELLPCVVRQQKLFIPKEILVDMGLYLGDRFYYKYSPNQEHIPILIKKDNACAKCGEYSLPSILYKPIFGQQSRGVCPRCRIIIHNDILGDILDSEICPDNINTEFDEAEMDRSFCETLIEDRLEESRNGTLSR